MYRIKTRRIFMPINLPNRARITFNGSDVVLSNETNTTLINQFTINVTKTPVAPSAVQGGNAVYTLRMTNTGSGTLFAPTFTDDLGAGQLTYVVGSAQFFKNGNPIAGTATVNSPTELVFTTNETLDEDDNFIVVYAVTVGSAQTEDITNTVVGTARGGCESGCEATDSDDAEISIEYTANVSIFKYASEETVSCGDTLSYTFTLMNTGNEAAEDVIFIDTLPEQFTVTAVSYTADSVTTPIPASDYTIDAANTLTIPAENSAFSITVPAATSEGPGIIIITVTGTIG